MSTTAPDPFTSMRTGWADAVQQLMQATQSMWDELAAPFTASGPPGGGMPWAGSRTTRPSRDDDHHHDRLLHDHRDHRHGEDRRRQRHPDRSADDQETQPRQRE